MGLLEPLFTLFSRFYQDGMYTRKKQNFVNFDLRNLNLSHYVVPGFDNQFSHFNLYAVSNHFGNLEGGHYTAYASSDVLKKWYKFDDQVGTHDGIFLGCLASEGGLLNLIKIIIF